MGRADAGNEGAAGKSADEDHEESRNARWNVGGIRQFDKEEGLRLTN